eukprot:gene30769-37176_t
MEAAKLFLLLLFVTLVCVDGSRKKPKRTVEVEGSSSEDDSSACPSNETVTDFHNMLTLPKNFVANKISFRAVIPHFTEFVVADVKGPGCIRQLWMVTGIGDRLARPQFCTFSADSLSMIVRIYFDDEPVPSVEVPLGPMFGIFHDIGDNWRASRQFGADTALFKMSENGAYTFITPMPFSKSVRITIQDENPDLTGFMRIWLQANYYAYDPRCPFPEPLRLHIAYRMQDRPSDYTNSSVRYKRSYHIGYAQGRGYLLGTALGLQVRDTNDLWFHNAGEMVIADHTTNPRVFKGTGGEDFFCSSCWFNFHHTYPDWGYLYGSNSNNFSAYRFFVSDFQLPFKSEISLSYGVNIDHVQSVMYWYQTKPSLQISKQYPLEARTMSQPMADAFQQYALPAPTGHIPYWNITSCRHVQHWPQSSMDNPHHKQLSFSEETFIRPIFGFVSVGEYFFPYGMGNDGYPVNCFIWLRGVYKSPKKQPVRIMITHDDPFDIYLNGDLLYSKDTQMPGYHSFNIYTTLDAGRNEFQVKAANLDNTNARAFVIGVNLFFNEARKKHFYLQQRGGFANADEQVKKERSAGVVRPKA